MKRDEIAERAKELEGKSRSDVGCSGSHAWCANFVSEVLESVGIDMYDLSCNAMKAKMDADPKWDEPETWPKSGDIIFFDWDREKDPEFRTRPLDHVGIIVDYSSDGTITYINGNGSSETHVTKQTIHVNNAAVKYWMRYVGDERSAATIQPINAYNAVNLPVLSKGCKGTAVKNLQRLLFANGYSIGSYGDDGDFGTLTEKALLSYQYDNHIVQSGVTDIKTWSTFFPCTK